MADPNEIESPCLEVYKTNRPNAGVEHRSTNVCTGLVRSNWLLATGAALKGLCVRR
jgi:hypothetical protein